MRYRRGQTVLPPVTSPGDAPEEIDENVENRMGKRSRRHRPKPVRLFPHLFPVPTELYGVITILGALFIVAALFYEVREILSPFVLTGVAVVLLYPFRAEPKLRPVMMAASVVFVIWLVSTSLNIIMPFAMAFGLAYIVDPMVTKIQRKYYVKRWILALVFTMILVGLMVLAIGYMLPLLIAQLGTAIAELDQVGNALVAWARSGELAAMIGISQAKLDQMLNTYVVPRLANLDTTIIGAAAKAGESAPVMLAESLNYLMIPFVMFYFIKDYWSIRGSIYSFLPQEYQRRSQHFLRDLDEVVGGYLRGDLITSVFQGAFIGVGLALIGVPGALLLGVVNGFCNLIPFIGSIIGYGLSIAGAMTVPDPAMTLLWVTLLHVAQTILEATVITPHIMGRHTDLHPLIVILSLALFGYFMGIGGLLLAIPVSSLLIRYAIRWRDDRRAEIEQEKVAADLRENPHHAPRHARDQSNGVSPLAGPKGVLP